ncbi:prepilin peptidase [Patescibacteria group bacterium]|nr:MAG: prepilin peptidase [Patescibacteria group bacterium]
MEIAVIYIALVLIGLCLGSFAGAMAWRLRARQLVEDKDNDEEYDKDEYKSLKKLTKTSIARDRSQCLHCSYVLRWYDLIPLVSWLSLGGKCRHCHKPIGYLEPLLELSVALFFVLSYMFWPYPLTHPLDVARLIIWLAAGVGFAILFVYDTKWFLLPNKVNFIVIGLGVLGSIITVAESSNIPYTLASIGGSVLILSGLYYVLYKISKGKWVGFGDIKLGLGLSLLLADYQLAFIAIFAANLIGCIIVIPGMIAGKLKRDSHVPFGPLLILGTIVAQLAGVPLIDWYLGSLL